jgi:ferrous iron transport protein B
MKAAFWSIPENFSQLGSALINPVLASAADNSVSQSVYGIMAQRFDGQIGAYAYLLFVLLYIPCVSTMAVIRQEASNKLMWISVIWSFIVAYAVAVLFYQSAKWIEYSPQSVFWIIAFMFAMFLLMVLRYYTKRNIRRQDAITNT